MVRTLIFDLGNVLIPFDITRGYAALAPYCPLPVEELARRVSSSKLVAQFERGESEPKAFARRFSDLLGLRVDYPGFCEAWNSIFLPDPLISEETLERLHRGRRLLVLSNTNAIHFEMVRRRYDATLRHFDGYLLSHEVGAQKPDPRMYQAALERAGCAPEECFYTDDIPAYVEAARRLGIDGATFESAAQLERELKARGVAW